MSDINEQQKTPIAGYISGTDLNADDYAVNKNEIKKKESSDNVYDPTNTRDKSLELALGHELEESEQLDEFLVKKVNPDGTITKLKDRKTRKRLATQTTGISKSKRRLIAIKATKTKRHDVGGQKKALRKRKRTLKKRKNLGL